MKISLIFISIYSFFAFSFDINAQKTPVPNYYKSIDFSDKKTLFIQLSKLITKTHKTKLKYSPDTWQALKKTDEDPNNPNKILLMYGTNNMDQDITNDLSRDKNKGGNKKGNWNREHVYPRSMGKPNLGYTGAGADIHMLRPSDVKQNGKRGNLPFEDAKGAARKINKSWYPGDRWRGDVARIVMYMYVRYGSKADPKRVAKNGFISSRPFPELFLQWNAQDPVDFFEKNRNEKVYLIQGNRNPFIDNPYIAHLLWGGAIPQKNW